MSRVTVLFATLNGAHTLPRMLDTLQRLEPPAERVEGDCSGQRQRRSSADQRRRRCA